MDNDHTQRTGTAPVATTTARRGLFGGAAAAAALAGVASLGLSPRPALAAGVSDVDIANFALNLEYLEAEFYLRAAFGRGLDSGDVGGKGTLGSVIGGRRVTFKDWTIREYAQEIARDEEAHVKFLRSALGSAAVARPTIDLRKAFTTAAVAAGLIRQGQTFDAFANEDNFLLAAFIFEDVGVTAYKGAAPLIQDKGILKAAAGILAVEAYHAGLVRTVLFGKGQFAATKAISDLRDKADGPGDKDQGIGGRDKGNIVPTDENGIAFSRSTSEVLKIVYLGGSAAGYGFFPDRLNGKIR